MIIYYNDDDDDEFQYTYILFHWVLSYSWIWSVKTVGMFSVVVI